MCFVVKTLEYCKLWQEYIQTRVISIPTASEHPIQEWETKFVTQVLRQASTCKGTKTIEHVQIHTCVVFIIVCNQLEVHRLVHTVQTHLAAVLSRMPWNTYSLIALGDHSA
jgi:hypothetical protein